MNSSSPANDNQSTTQLRSTEGQPNLNVLREKEFSNGKGEQQEQQDAKEVQNVAQNNMQQTQYTFENNPTNAYALYNYSMQNLGQPGIMQNAAVPIQNHLPMQTQAVPMQNAYGQNYIVPQATQSYIQPANIQSAPTYLQPYVLPTQSLPFVNHGTNYAPAFHPTYSAQKLPLTQQPIQNLQTPQYVPQTPYVAPMQAYNAALQGQVLQNASNQFPQNVPSIQAVQMQNYMQPMHTCAHQISQATQNEQTNRELAQVVQSSHAIPQMTVQPVQLPQTQILTDAQPNVNPPLPQAVHAVPPQMVMVPVQQTISTGHMQQPVVQSNASRNQMQQTVPVANQQPDVPRVASTHPIQQITVQQTASTSEIPQPEVHQTMSQCLVQQPVMQHVQENIVSSRQLGNQNIPTMTQAEVYPNRTVCNEPNDLQPKISSGTFPERHYNNRYWGGLNVTYDTNHAFLFTFVVA